jgi:SAM-dependent MidA family methyltransferase
MAMAGVGCAAMPGERTMIDVLRNLLHYGDLSFRDFVELALYHPEFGYYSRAENPVGKRGDYVTAPTLSPAFAFAISRLVREFVGRSEGEVCSIVDIGCGDGSLIRALVPTEGRFYGVDRALERAAPLIEDGVTFVRTIDEVPNDGPAFLFSNELFDALPFTRLVQRGEHLHELWVRENDGVLDWSEHEAAPSYDHYFGERGITLTDGQFADVSLEWEAYYRDIAGRFPRALIVTMDYGFPGDKLFHGRIRRFGTAAAYSQQRVTRDLLANPGQQDLTAHINFTDLQRVGEELGGQTLFFDRLAKFLLSIGITEHELFRPVDGIAIADADAGLQLLAAREDAKRLILPDGMGEDLRVLVQGRGISFEKWSFQRPLF